MPTCTPAEFMILNFILRKTIGFNKDLDRLSYSQISQGTGIKGKATINKAIYGLLEKGYIIKQGVQRGAIWYGINRSLEIETGSEIEPDENSAKNHLVQKLNQLGSEIEPDDAKLVQKLNTQKTYLKDKRQHDHVAADNSPDLPDLNPDLTAAMLLYKNNIGPMNGIVSSDFQDIFNGLSPPPGETKTEWIEYAVYTASANGKNKWAYVKAIINGISESGGLHAHRQRRNQHKLDRSGSGKQDFNGSTSESGAGQKQGTYDENISTHESYSQNYSRVNDRNIAEHIRKLTN